MADTTPSPNTRERILDAAADVMRRDGLVHATTKQIARAAECSEALLYKHFPAKRDLFLHVLTERSAPLDLHQELAGAKTVEENLITLTRNLIDFYAANFPMAAAIFGSTELLEEHRKQLRERGAGPHMPSKAVVGYLEAERDLCRITHSDDKIRAVSRLLTGGALHEAFLASYADYEIKNAEEIARQLVSACALDQSEYSRGSRSE